MALFEIDESSGLPVWVQLRNRFVYLIKTGHYQPGDQLPSVRTLAAEAAINYNTVSKVYVNLESDGYVESVRGRGVFVRDIGGKADDVRSIADTEIEGCIRALSGPGNDHRRGHPAHDGRGPPFEGRKVDPSKRGEFHAKPHCEDRARGPHPSRRRHREIQF